MSFDLLGFLTKILGGLNVDGIENGALAWLNEKGGDYPDLSDRAKALAAWLGQTIDEAKVGLDPAAMHNTLLGIAADVVHNAAGVNPKAWLFGG